MKASDAFGVSNDGKPMSMREIIGAFRPTDVSYVVKLDESDIEIIERWRGFVESDTGEWCTRGEIVKALLRHIDDGRIACKASG